MGNLCSKSANKSDNFAGQGRVVGTASQSTIPASAPLPPKISTSTPGRSLGGTEGLADTDARSAAARAAEERSRAAQKGTSGGKLSANLEAQKRQTRNSLLAAGSEEEQQARAADAATEARTYN